MEFRDKEDRVNDVRNDPDSARGLLDHARLQIRQYSKDFPPNAAELETWMRRLGKIADHIEAFCPPFQKG